MKRKVFCVLAAAAWLSACGGFEVCDIRETGCQDDVFYAVLDARDEPWDEWSVPPPMRVISASRFREELEAELGGSTPPYTPFETGLYLLGMQPPSTTPSAIIDSEVANVAAYYSSTSRSVTIINHGTQLSDEYATFTLAHELTHAVQDRYGALAGNGDAKTDDEVFARNAVFEGEAVVDSNLVMLRAVGRSFENVHWDDYFSAMLESMLGEIVTSPARMYQSMQSLVYPLGGRLVAHTYESAGNPAVRALLRDPPPTALAVIEDYGSRAAAGEVTCMPATPVGYQALGAATLGAVGVAALVAPAAGVDATMQLAAGWRGDAFSLLTSASTSQVAVVWRIRLQDASVADTCLDLLNGLPGTQRVYQRGSEVVLAAAEDAVLLDAWDPTACP